MKRNENHYRLDVKKLRLKWLEEIERCTEVNLQSLGQKVQFYHRQHEMFLLPKLLIPSNDAVFLLSLSGGTATRQPIFFPSTIIKKRGTQVSLLYPSPGRTKHNKKSGGDLRK